MNLKFTCIAMSCFVAMSAFGAVLSPEEALQRFEGNRRYSQGLLSKHTQPFELKHSELAADGVATVYLFSSKNDGSYLVLPADDLAAPLLGYSDGGREFLSDSTDGEMPPAMKWWLGEYSRQIEAMRSEENKLPAPKREAENASERTPIAPLCSTRWGQGEPYNLYCPVVDEQNSLTGCGATALAQVMKYHQWPRRGEGTVTCTDIYENEYSMDLGTVEFDWGNMTDTYGEQSSEAEKDAVAQLMKACGYAVDMTYSPSASSSNTTDIAVALRHNFGYASSVIACQMSQYRLDQWEQMLYDNLAKIGPVIYRGYSFDEGGHLFVCDGYSTDGFFHFNWGWYGMYDGYFRLTALNPGVPYSGIENSGYSQGQWAIFGICKPSESVTPTELTLTQDGRISTSVDGSVVTLNCGWWNYSGEIISGEICVTVYPASDESDFKGMYITCGRSDNLQCNYGWRSLTVDLGEFDLPDGMYLLYPRWIDSTDDKVFESMIHPLRFADYGVVSVEDGVFTAYDVCPDLLKVSDVEIPAEIYNGRNFKIKMTVTNECANPVMAYVYPVLSYDLDLVSESNGCLISLNPGETAVKECLVNFSFTEPEDKTGTYRIHIMDYDAWEALAAREVTVKDDPGAPVLECKSFELTGGTENVNPCQLEFVADLECMEGYHATPVVVDIYNVYDDSDHFIMSNYSSPVLMNTSDKATVRMNVSLDGYLNNEPEFFAVLFYRGGDKYYQLGMINFTVNLAGTESVSADDNGMEVNYDPFSACVTVKASGGVNNVAVIAPDGTTIAEKAFGQTAEASVQLSGISKGVYIVIAQDCKGNRKTAKFVIGN